MTALYILLLPQYCVTGHWSVSAPVFIELVLNSLSRDSPPTEGSEQFAPPSPTVSHDLITLMFYNTSKPSDMQFPSLCSIAPPAQHHHKKSCTSGQSFSLASSPTSCGLPFFCQTPGYERLNARRIPTCCLYKATSQTLDWNQMTPLAAAADDDVKVRWYDVN